MVLPDAPAAEATAVSTARVAKGPSKSAQPPPATSSLTHRTDNAPRRRRRGAFCVLASPQPSRGCSASAAGSAVSGAACSSRPSRSSTRPTEANHPVVAQPARLRQRQPGRSGWRWLVGGRQARRAARPLRSRRALGRAEESRAGGRAEGHQPGRATFQQEAREVDVRRSGPARPRAEYGCRHPRSWR